MRRYFKHIPRWEWFVCFAVLALLGLFLLGKDWFGLNGTLSSLFALEGALLSTLIAFVTAALIGPLLALVGALLAGVITALGVIVATLITPLVALGVSLFGTIVSWLAATWVGALFSPVYGMIAPVILKISPLLTLGKYGHKIYDWLDDQPWWPQKLVFTANRRLHKATAELARASQLPVTKKKSAARKRRR